MHVRSHQSTVSIIMFQEWNQRCSHRNNLVRSNIHVAQFFWLNHREVTFESCFNSVVFENAFICNRGVSLSYIVSIFFFCSQINYIFRHVHFSIAHLSIRCLDESHAVHFGMYTKRRDQTNVWTFWSLNGTQTTVVSVVNVTYLETGSFSRKTTRS